MDDDGFRLVVPGVTVGSPRWRFVPAFCEHPEYSDEPSDAQAGLDGSTYRAGLMDKTTHSLSGDPGPGLSVTIPASACKDGVECWSDRGQEDCR